MPEYVIVRGMIHVKHDTSPHRTVCGEVFGDTMPPSTIHRGFCANCEDSTKTGDLVLDR